MNNSLSPKTTLKHRLAQPAILLAPGVYDALSALIAEQAGFEALYVSGASIAYTCLGRSDVGLTTFESRSIQKLNLLVFLTPTLVRDEMDVVELNVRKSADLGILQRESRIEEPTRLKQDVLEKLERQNGTFRTLPNTVDPSAPLQPPVRPE